ncbi:MAG: CvpA family protein [Chloroflexi bacterium]|jgi:uncharacterized membrane protein required for colicin V production|nr:MAG: CvpA family protein [Chloroflexota bacterium]
MVTLNFFFLFLVAIFAVIGAMRGWAKELLVTFSVVLSIFVITVLERYVPAVYNTFSTPGSTTQFWMRTIIVTLLTFFGYQTPNLPRLSGTRFVREKFQDSLLGFFLGAFNGYLIIGTIWFFLHQANYPFPYITPPIPGTEQGDAALRLINILPPRWLDPPIIYFAVSIAFLFVIVVFL